MPDTLASRIAAATAAAEADRVPVCQFCRATGDLIPWHMEAGRVLRHACQDKAACHERFLRLVMPDTSEHPSADREAPETARAGAPAVESSTTHLEGT